MTCKQHVETLASQCAQKGTNERVGYKALDRRHLPSNIVEPINISLTIWHHILWGRDIFGLPIMLSNALIHSLSRKIELLTKGAFVWKIHHSSTTSDGQLLHYRPFVQDDLYFGILDQACQTKKH